MKLEDIPLPETVENEVKDYFYNIRLLLNNGRYQSTISGIAPTVDTSGQSGELRLVIEGNEYRLFFHDGTSWYKSGLFSKVT